MKNNIPEKPKTQKEQISMLWDAVYNHLPTRLGWIDIKIGFIMGFLGLILALLGVLIMRG